ncbi:MAG: division/cell wall cluster transcriptional repressor MraZ [Chloroflexota bacterium]|nr:division/cell wall cluster transcriptional repressor MraZ [Chloroflexota bacterium]
MFAGEFEHTVDSKGRLTIPVKFREALADGLYLTRGLDGCLFAYPPDAWQQIADQAANRPLTESGARNFSRMFYSSTECRLDKQGRILVPAQLREYAAIENEAVIVGMNSRLEIWSKDRWRAITSKMMEDVFAQQISELGI